MGSTFQIRQSVYSKEYITLAFRTHDLPKVHDAIVEFDAEFIPDGIRFPLSGMEGDYAIYMMLVTSIKIDEWTDEHARIAKSMGVFRTYRILVNATSIDRIKEMVKILRSNGYVVGVSNNDEDVFIQLIMKENSSDEMSYINLIL